jgi:hypothetical protein
MQGETNMANTVKVYNTRASILVLPSNDAGEGPSLVPGANEIDADYWKKAQSHKTVKTWFDEGWISNDAPKDLGSSGQQGIIAGNAEGVTMSSEPETTGRRRRE